MNKRLRRLKGLLAGRGLLPYLVYDLTNIRYLTGFTGSYAVLVVGRDDSFLISDSRYEEYSRSILDDDVRFVLQKGDFLTVLESELKKNRAAELNCESHSMKLPFFFEMKKKMRGIAVVPADDAVNELRMVKDDEEIELLRQAAGLTDRCMKHLARMVKPGLREWDVSLEIEYYYRSRGCRRSSFDAIVASGPGSSMPHYETSMKKRLKKGDVLLIDMGCQYHGYNSDLTRTIFIHSIDPLMEKIYGVVRRARAAIEAVRPGITTGKLDAIAREIIAAEGFGMYFGHSLGHGLGLDIHELPAVKAGGLTLKKNMVITIEPGIYIPGKGGVRIEDMVLVTGKGSEVMTRSTKDILIV
jgi:Xaa-Pro aminopeptidase